MGPPQSENGHASCPPSSTRAATASSRSESSVPRSWLVLLLPGMILAILFRGWAVTEWEIVRAGSRSARPPSFITYQTGRFVLDVLNYLTEWLTPPDMRASQLMNGYFNTAIIHHMVRLGALDVWYEEEPGPQPRCLSCDEVGSSVASLGQHPEWSCRLLPAAAVVGVLHYQPNKGCYTLTEVGKRFVGPSSSSMRAMALWHGGDVMLPWFDGVIQALQQPGDAAPVEVIHGHSFWNYLAKHPERREVFDQYLGVVTRILSPAVTASMHSHLRRARHVCDIGGGEGALLAAFMTQHPHLNGTIFDLPETFTDEPVTHNSSAYKRMNKVVGSFLAKGEMREKLEGACDVLVMKNILHDWGDEACHTILQEARQALLSYKVPSDSLAGYRHPAPERAQLWVVEGLLSGPESRGVMDQLKRAADMMMMVTVGSGKERTLDGFRELYRRAGLRVVEVVETSSPIAVMVVEAVEE